MSPSLSPEPAPPPSSASESSSVPSAPSAPSASSMPEEEPEPIKYEFFQVNLNDNKEPEPILLGRVNNASYFERIRKFDMSPDCTIIWGGSDDVQIIYNCLDGSWVDYYNSPSFPSYERFINGTYLALREQPMGSSWIERQDENADGWWRIVSPDFQISFTYFDAAFLKTTEKHLYVNDFDYDATLRRYYCTALFEVEIYEYRVLCAEYDKDFNLLYYMVADNIEAIQVKAYQIIQPSIIALGNRKVYTNYGVEFDFNTLTYQRKDYSLPQIFFEDTQSGFYTESRTPVNENTLWGVDVINSSANKGQYLIRTATDIRVISYIEGELWTLYKTPEIQLDPDTGDAIEAYEVETDQGIIAVTGFSSRAWAPDEGVYIFGGCKKYQWEMPTHLKDYFQADYYEKGVFKLLPDGKIHFVAPLPKGMDFAGEDTNGMSYFYKSVF